MKPRSSSPVGNTLFIAAAITLAATSSTVQAATWSGGAAPINLWSNGLNWGGSAPVANETLTFTGTANTSTNNDLALGTQIGTGLGTAITFSNSSTGGVFTLAGNQITLGGNIVTTGTTGTPTHLISLNLILNGDRTITAISDNNLNVSGLISEDVAGRALIKSGAGILTLSNNLNSFTGAITAGQGTTRVSSMANSGVASAIGAGSVINLGSATTTAGTLEYTGTGTTTNRTIHLAATTTGQGRISHTGANGGTGLILTGTVTNAGSGAKTFFLEGTNTDANEITSLITNGAGGGTLAVQKVGTANWKFSNDSNSFTGAFIVSGAAANNTTTSIATITSLAAKNVASAAGAGSAINFGNGTTGGGNLYYIGTGVTTDRDLNFTATTTGHAAIFNNGANGGTGLRFTGTITNSNTSGTKVFYLGGANTDANEVSSNIGANQAVGGTLALTKTGTGTWLLSGPNTYTGATTVSAGTLSFSNAGNVAVANSLGQSGSAAANLLLGNGSTLRYTGSGGSTDRLFTVNGTSAGHGATLDASGSGAISYTNTGGIAYGTGDQTRTLTLGGSNTGSNTLASAIGNNGTGLVSINKTGAGRWVLTGSNTSTGGVTINNGTLQLSGAGTLASQTVTVNANSAGQTALLDLNGTSLSISNLNLGGTGGTSTSTSNVQTGAGILTMTGGLTYDATGNSLGSTISGAGFNMGGGIRTFTVNNSANAANDLTISAPITNGGFIKTGAGTLLVSGTGNNFNLGAYFRNGTVKMGAANPLSMGTLYFQSIEASVASATFDLGGFNQTIGNLQLAFSGSVSESGFQSKVIDSVGGAVLKLSGGVSYNASTNSNEYGQATVSANLDLNGATRTFAIHDSTIASVDTLVSGAIQNSTGTAGLTKTLGGTLVLDGTNTYNGATTITAGTLAIGASGSIANSSSVVLNGGTLDVSAKGPSGLVLNSSQSVVGSGTVVGNLTVNGIMAIGASPGTVIFNDSLTIGGGAVSNFEFADVGLGAGTFDLAQGSGDTVTFGGVLNLFFSGGTYANGSSVSIFNGFGIYSGDFAEVNFSGLGVGQSAVFDSSNGFVTVVPEPSSALLLLGAAGTLAFRRRRV